MSKIKNTPVNKIRIILVYGASENPPIFEKENRKLIRSSTLKKMMTK
jgi:hypothetical protein